MPSPSIVIELIDADGCVYNQKYRDYLVWLFSEYGATLDAINLQRLHAKKNNLPRPELIDEVIKLIIEDLHSLNAADMSQEELLKREQLIEENGKKDFDTEMRHYLSQIYLLDQNILNQIFMAANPELISHIEKHADKNVLQYLADGSNRQTNGFDQAGMRDNLTGSIFQDLYYLVQHLHDTAPPVNCRPVLLPLTMADVSAGLPRGESYRRIITNPRGKHANYVCDASKLTLLYSMAHDTAAQHPGEDIRINFYDNDDDILDELYRKLGTKPGSDLLPKSVSVMLQKYNGEMGEGRLIQGTGEEVDKDYRSNVRYMMCNAMLHPDYMKKQFVNVAKDTDIEETLLLRTIAPANKTLAVMLDADGCIYNWKYFHLVMTLMKKHGKTIKRMARKIINDEETKKFRKQLLQEISEYENKIIDENFILEYEALQGFIGESKDFDVKDLDLMEDEDEYKVHPSIPKIRQTLRYFQAIDQTIVDEILYHANQDIFANILVRAKADGCTQVVLLVGSNRQSVTDDEHCSKTNGTGSFHEDINRLTRLLNDKFHEIANFTLDQFLLADLFSDLDAGESFRLSLHNPHDAAHANTVFDDSKVSVVYAMLHHIARYYPDTYAVQFYDDRVDIFEMIRTTYGENDKHKLLPKGLRLEMIPYRGSIFEPPVFAVIDGSGRTDHGAHHAVKLMATLAKVDITDVRDRPKSANIANDVDFSEFVNQRRVSRPAKDLLFDALTTVKRVTLNPRTSLGLFDQQVVKAETQDIVIASASAASVSVRSSCP